MRKINFSWKTTIVIAVFLVLVILGLWKRNQGNPLKSETGHGLSSTPLFEPHDRSVSILIKTVEMSTGKPVNVPTSIRQSKSRYNQMKQAVLAFLDGPRKGKFQVPVPEGMALNEFYLTPEGTAVVDLSMTAVNRTTFGFVEEALFVKGLIEVLSKNFFEVKMVKILVDGQDAPTLAGHYALGTSDSAASTALGAYGGPTD
jgi:hypothetical protein